MLPYVIATMLSKYNTKNCAYAIIKLDKKLYLDDILNYNTVVLKKTHEQLSAYMSPT